MTDQRYRIAPFVDLPGTVELVGIGRVRRPRGGALEAELEVLLVDCPKGHGSYARLDEHIAWVGCGQLDLLTPGSRWLDGYHEDDARTYSASALGTLRGKEALGDGTTADRHSHPSGRIADALCFVVALSDVAHEKGGAEHAVSIPVNELARALFGVSSRMLLELLDGMRDPVVVPGRGLYDRRTSGMGGQRKVVIRAYRRLTKREAVMAALVIADPDIRRCHDLIFQQLSVAPSWGDHHPTFLDVPWPFKRPTRLSFEGRWVKRTDGTTRFLVTRILGIDLLLPFDEIELHHPGGTRAPGGLPAPSRMGRLAFGRTDTINLVTGRAPSSRWRSRVLPTRDAPVQVGANVTIRVFPHGGTAPPRAPGLGVPPEKQSDHSSATPGPMGDAGVRPALTQRTGDGAEPPPERTREMALEATWQALLLAERLGANEGWEVEAMPARVNGRMPVSPYDPVNGVLLVEISTDGGPAVVLDCGSHGNSRRSLGVLARLDRAFLSVAAADRLRTVAAVNDGRWRDRLGKPVAVSGYEVIAMNRGPTVWNDPLAYAKAIHETVTFMLRKMASRDQASPVRE